jgi:predicted site-specific integrase-resolvase
MSSAMPQVSNDGRYTVKETCQLLGIKSRNTLRSYVAQGLIKEGRRRTNDRPFYLGSEILKCWSAIA